ncbi:MAG: hypothetical protein PHU25_21720 [Deltaproteobacteria bacterium]|nr:hypothetical protein [Deltaproteobacteria bacterium]
MTDAKHLPAVLLLLATAWGGAACYHVGPIFDDADGKGADADGDADGDSDGDADSDTDGDSDTGDDTGSDTDNDNDTDIDTDADTDGDTDGDSDIVPSGRLLWAVNAGGGGADWGGAISGFVDGASMVTGAINGYAVFGRGEIAETHLGSSGPNFFVARYGRSGALDWASAPLRLGSVETTMVAALTDGATALGGDFTDVLVLGAGTFDTVTLTSAGHRGAFFARLDADGSPDWAAGLGDKAEAYPGAVAAMPDGAFVALASFSGTAVVGQGTRGETSFAASGTNDLLIARFAADGSLDWARAVTGSGECWGTVAGIDDGFLAYGWCLGENVFGPGEGNETVLDSGSEGALFLARYGADGNLEWARLVSGSNAGFGYGLAALPDGSAVWVTGVFHGTQTFGEGDPNETTVTAPEDIGAASFVARYDGGGRFDWVTHPTSGSLDGRVSIVARGDGTAFLAGTFHDSVAFDEGQPSEARVTTPSPGNPTVVVARLETDGRAGWMTWAGSITGGSEGYGISVAKDKVVVTGLMQGDADFGAGEPNHTLLDCFGDLDVFVAAYEP